MVTFKKKKERESSKATGLQTIVGLTWEKQRLMHWAGMGSLATQLMPGGGGVCIIHELAAQPDPCFKNIWYTSASTEVPLHQLIDLRFPQPWHIQYCVFYTPHEWVHADGREAPAHSHPAGGQWKKWCLTLKFYTKLDFVTLFQFREFAMSLNFGEYMPNGSLNKLLYRKTEYPDVAFHWDSACFMKLHWV